MLALCIGHIQSLRVCCLQGQHSTDGTTLQELRPRAYQILQVGRFSCLVDLLVVGPEAIGRVSWINAALCSAGHTHLILQLLTH